MKKFFKNKVTRIISIIILTIGGCVFLISIPKIFSVTVVKTIDFFFGGLPSESQRDSNGNVIHQDGRKTIQSFGKNKRFAIERCFKDKNSEDTWILHDRGKNKDIDNDVEDYRWVSPYVYTKGEKGYTKLNYETAEIQQNEDINEFSKEDQKIFERLEKEKSRIKH